MAAHSQLFSPSRASQRLKCPGSARMEALYPDTGPKPYAEEGSSAHALGERCLRKGENAIKYLNRRIVRVADGWSILADGSKRTDGFEVTRNMVDAVQTYLDYVRGHEPDGGTVNIEHRVKITDDSFGTADYSYAVPFGPLYVDDYKHGQGVLVSAEENAQAMCYALGVLLESPYEHSEVRISIIQPRSREPLNNTIPWLGEAVKGVDGWALPASELIRWRNGVLIPGIERCKDPNAPLAAGNHCRFCSAKAMCPEMQKEVFDIVPVNVPSLPAPTTLTNEQIGSILDKKAMAESWLDEIEALAYRKVEAGEVVPGAAGAYKVVEGRSTRDWLDENTAKTALLASLGNDAYEWKMLSPAKAEKAFKERGIDHKSLAPLVGKKSGKPTLVPATDKRLALPSSAARAFSDIPVNNGPLG